MTKGADPGDQGTWLFLRRTSSQAAEQATGCSLPLPTIVGTWNGQTDVLTGSRAGTGEQVTLTFGSDGSVAMSSASLEVHGSGCWCHEGETITYTFREPMEAEASTDVMVVHTGTLCGDYFVSQGMGCLYQQGTPVLATMSQTRLCFTRQNG